MDAIIVGAGLTGGIIARFLADQGKKVKIVERRSYVGGNLKDHVEEHGFLVQDHGPHAFHTDNEELVKYLNRFGEWKTYHLRCGAVINGHFTPTPFNFSTVDTFYSPEEADKLKQKMKNIFSERETVTVTEALEHTDNDIRNYAEFLFEHDYAPYTAKQWGVSPDMIAPSVLKRVPLRMSYRDGYFEDTFQILPEVSYSSWFEKLLDHDNIEICLNTDALSLLKICDNTVLWDERKTDAIVIYTGALDELFEFRFGRLPYRSLHFEWEYSTENSLQEVPIVAFPQEKGYTRITEYKKLPEQDVHGTVRAWEYPDPYDANRKQEPYYPVLTEESMALYQKYLKLANEVKGLIICGRLADFRYYNMDKAMERAFEICRGLKEKV